MTRQSLVPVLGLCSCALRRNTERNLLQEDKRSTAVRLCKRMTGRSNRLVPPDAKVVFGKAGLQGVVAEEGHDGII